MTPVSDVVNTDLTFFRLLVAGDVSGLQNLLADDFILVDVVRGQEITKTALLEVLVSEELKFIDIQSIESHARVYRSTAIVVGRTEMKTRFGDQEMSLASRYTHVFIKSEEAWKLVSAQGTQIA